MLTPKNMLYKSSLQVRIELLLFSELYLVMFVCHSASNGTASMTQSVFMVRFSHTNTHTTCRVWCWGMEWTSEVMLEMRVSQCTSACQCSSRSSAVPSADLSCMEMSWQACRLLCAIAKVPISPCRGNSLRKPRCTSTQETWLSLYSCMWQPQSGVSGHSFQSAPGQFLGTQGKMFSWHFKWWWSFYEGNDYWLTYVQRMSQSRPVWRSFCVTLIYFCQYSSYSLTTDGALQHTFCFILFSNTNPTLIRWAEKNPSADV